MAKSVGLVFSLCFLALALGHVHAHEVFNVEGDVYCDPCRVQFVTDLSKKLPGATVRLECRNLETKAVTYAVEGMTDAGGRYSLAVSGDHEKDNCEVSVVKSGRADCSEPMSALEKARIVCTANSGIHAAARYANPIGFMTKLADPQCSLTLFNMGIAATLN